MPQRIRILLIDDHTLFRESLVRLLEREPQFDVVSRCATVSEGRHTLASTQVDIILLDYDLGDEVGTELLAGLDAESAGLKTILVTAGMRPEAMLHAIASGVAGIVLKHSDPRLLIEAILSVAAGKRWWDSGTVDAILPQGSSSAASTDGARLLTPRQRKVLRAILDGLTNKEIAMRLQASESAVKATIQELFHKAGVRTRGQLVRVAIERYSLEWLADEQAQTL